MLKMFLVQPNYLMSHFSLQGQWNARERNCGLYMSIFGLILSSLWDVVNILAVPLALLLFSFVLYFRAVLEVRFILIWVDVHTFLERALDFVGKVRSMSMTVQWTFCRFEFALPMFPSNKVLALIRVNHCLNHFFFLLAHSWRVWIHAIQCDIFATA